MSRKVLSNEVQTPLADTLNVQYYVTLPMIYLFFVKPFLVTIHFLFSEILSAKHFNIPSSFNIQEHQKLPFPVSSTLI